MSTRIAFLAVALMMVPLSRDAQAGPRDRQIKKLKRELETLERSVKQALQFRARYRNLRASTYFYESLNRQDGVFLGKVLKYLNSPVSIFEAFLSSEPNNYQRAKQTKGRYAVNRTTLWLKCRFGLQAVRNRSYYTVRVDVVDAASGSRIYQSLGPWQRRISKMITKITVPINRLRVRSGRYQLRITVEAGGKSVYQKIPYYHGNSGNRRYRRNPTYRRPRPPVNRGDGIHTM